MQFSNRKSFRAPAPIPLFIFPTPASDRRDDDHGPPIYRHRTVLRILSAQTTDGFAVFLAALYNPRFPKHEDVGEFAPIFIVAIDDQSDVGIFSDILQPFKFAWCGAFRLLVDGRIEMFAVEDEADRNDVWLTACVGAGEMGDAGGADKGRVLSG